ncbi:hypothetical protein [Acinetobacter guillouiae]|uniref:hypothetical protein n=2 Tax=Acinetobacter TaxID=469 RepID=UPI0032B49A7A
MKVFDKSSMDELEAEILNQYLNIVWLEDYLNNGLKHVELVINFDMEGRPEPKTIEDWRGAPIIGIEVKIKRKQNLGSQHFKQQLYFTVEEYNSIYREMEESCNDPKYDFLDLKFGYSIRELICLLDQITALRGELCNLNDKEGSKAYKEILHQYIGIDTLTYGIKNPSLRQRIAKGRSTQGEYQKAVKEKKKIFFDLLVKQVQSNGKYKNVSKAVSKNMDEIMYQFRMYDEAWIQKKKKLSMARIIKLNEEKQEEALTASRKVKMEKEIVKLSTFMQQLEDGLNHGYPFETLDNILPYNTTSLDDVLMKVLRLEKTIKEQCIEPS